VIHLTHAKLKLFLRRNGKTSVIFGFDYLGSSLNFATISSKISLENLLDTSFLGGIGFYNVNYYYKFCLPAR